MHTLGQGDQFTYYNQVIKEMYVYPVILIFIVSSRR